MLILHERSGPRPVSDFLPNLQSEGKNFASPTSSVTIPPKSDPLFLETATDSLQNSFLTPRHPCGIRAERYGLHS